MMDPQHLHFNMLLLNLSVELIKPYNLDIFTFQYASIKPIYADPPWAYRQRFTFQYASIKPNLTAKQTLIYCLFTFQYASIKPIPEEELPDIVSKIYISICFY